MDVSLLGSGPAQALAAIARRLRLPFDPEDLADRVKAHRSPRSLLALVEVAPSVGVTARAFQAEWTDLDTIQEPAIVHLQGEDDGSFVLLLEHDARGVVLESEASRARVGLDRERFEALWTGVVVLFERASGPLPAGARPVGLRTGAPLGRPRLAALCGLALLSLAGALRLGFDAGGLLEGALAAVVCALTFAATALSAVLVLASRRSRVGSATPALISKVCGRGSLLDCEGVLASKFSHVGRIELSVLGLSVLGGALTLEGLAAVLPEAARWAVAGWLALAFAAMAPGTLVLIGLQIWPLRRFCPLCLGVHACVLGAAALSFPMLPRSLDPAIAPWGIVHLVAALGTAGLVVPFLEGAIENRMHRSRLAWIGATPWGALAEAAGRPGVPDWGLDGSARLGSEKARFRADVLVHPTCGGCPPLLESLEGLRTRRPKDVQVVLQFPPRDPGRVEDRELCVALAAIARAQGGGAALAAFLAAKSSAWKLLEAAHGRGAPAVLAVLAPGLAPDDAMFSAARDAVARADRVLADLHRGTPALLIGGRPWDSPLEDFEALLTTHPEELAALFGLQVPQSEHV